MLFLIQCQILPDKQYCWRPHSDTSTVRQRRRPCAAFKTVTAEKLTSIRANVKSYLSASNVDWIGLWSVLRPRQHSIGYMGDGFYRSKDPTKSIKVLKENLQKKKSDNANNKIHICIHNTRQKGYKYRAQQVP